MLRVVVLSVLAGAALGQPTGCLEDENCQAGFHCEADAHFCRECLRCEDLRRRPPPRATACVKSVVDCGLCYDGLVEDIRGDVNAPCVAAQATDASERDGGISPLVWLAAALGGLFLVAVVGIVLYVLRNMDTFKVLSSTRASVQTPPEAPPPYRAAPPSAPAPALHDDDSSWPFIKHSPPYAANAGFVGGDGGAGSGAGSGTGNGTLNGPAREQAGAQAARIFNYPSYVRPPLIPNSYDLDSDQSEAEEPFSVHDEDTMESVWSPHEAAPPAPKPSTAGAVVAPEADLAPPAKRLCVPQDSNNNKGPGEGPSPSLEASSSAAPSFIISVVQNINTVQQRNDVKL